MLEQLGGSLTSPASAELEKPFEEHEVLTTGELLINCGFLAHQSNSRPDQLCLGAHIGAAHPDRAAVGSQQGGHYADGGGFASTVGTEHTADRPCPDMKIEASQCFCRSETLV